MAKIHEEEGAFEEVGLVDKGGCFPFQPTIGGLRVHHDLPTGV